MKQSERIAALEAEVAALKAQVALLAQQVVLRPTLPALPPVTPLPWTVPYQPFPTWNPFEVTCTTLPSAPSICVN